MSGIAQVIVDVPVMQTNKPFDYIIPKKLEGQLEAGMRVVVPFGNGKRKVQGFVTGITDVAAYEGKMKEIEGIMDLSPVLNEEMLQLGEYMAEKTFSFKISCYQTMLPAVMRAKYKKFIKILKPGSNDLPFEYKNDETLIPFEQIDSPEKLSDFLNLQKKGIVEVVYEVLDKRTKKKIKYTRVLLSAERVKDEKEKIGKRAPKQRDFLNWILNHENSRMETTHLIKESSVTPSVLKEAEKKGWVKTEFEEVYRDPFKNAGSKPTKELKLNSEQSVAYSSVCQAIEHKQAEVFLLKGVTGSGKTEVYLQSIAQVLKKGRGAMMLVPEISLTPLMVSRFKSRFGDRVALLHSGLSDGEKYDEWRKIANGEADVVVGARSSVFAPIKKLGIIIIDEEHESSYKQEENPRYHAKDIAIWRGRYHSCPVILGSATPSLESRARASKNVYTLLELKQRANRLPLPVVRVIDMKEEAKEGNFSIFSSALKKGIEQRIEDHEQVVLLLNRRGYSSFMLCRDCGFVLQCPNCDISLTLHKENKSMKCHYCGHQEAVPSICPQCQSNNIRFFGTGTQKVEAELEKMFPETSIVRMDIDTTRKKGSHQRLLERFERKKSGILLGTQMIAKGLDFPNVTLVGVLNADTAMALPDFRSSEKTFQLLTQVAGRAGRAELEGEVLIQTYNPEHYAIQLAKKHDYDQFYLKEMYLRHLSNYPPYYFIVQISVSHEKEVEAAKKMAEITSFLKDSLRKEAILLGPSPKSLTRIKNRYHYQTIIKYKKEPELFDRLHQLLQITQKDQLKGLNISIDPNPLQFL